MKEKLLKSYYNYFVPFEENTIIYNPFSGAIGLLDPDTYERFCNNKLTTDEENILVKKGILIEESFDERKQINSDRINGMRSPKNKSFRVWTTSGCNANCFYCFEKGIKAEKMNLNTADQVYCFIIDHLVDAEELVIEWFGGEPLLNCEPIDYLSERFKKYCLENKIKYSSTITTNGSLIAVDVAKKMKENWMVKRVQITLDGDRELYNKIKSYNDVKNCNFDSVINGMKILTKNNIYISVRLNYTGDNYESLRRLIGYIHENIPETSNIVVYIYPVWEVQNPDSLEITSTSTIADKNLIQLFEEIVANKLNTPRRVARLYYKKTSCIGYHYDGYTILPNGDISKCCETYFQKLGNVWDGITNQDLYNSWTSDDVEPECEECIFLPLCQGGCRASRYTQMPKCFAYKSVFPDIVKWYVRKMQESISGD